MVAHVYVVIGTFGGLSVLETLGVQEHTTITVELFPLG
jgi:hypothetical protein